MITMLWGRSADEWLDIDHVLQERGIKDAKELADVLSMRAAKEQLLPVFDKGNRSRLLGHLVDIDVKQYSGPYLTCVVNSRAPITAYKPTDTIHEVAFNKVEFMIDRLTKDGGWTYEPVLLTSSSLENLLRFDKFRLPGESRRQAEERLWRWR